MTVEPLKPMDDPLVSVVIPTYNRASLVLEAVESVLQGTYRNFELIVGDDGSSDITVETLVRRGFSVWPSPPTHSPPLILLTLPHTGFPGLVRNRGAQIAQGTYLAFLDSDDLWLPQKLELQLKAHKASMARGQRFRISHTRELWIRNGKTISQRKQRHRREGDVFRDSLRKCILGPSTVLMERSLFKEVGGFREDLRIAEDYELWIRITSSEPVLYIEEPLTVKRGGSLDQLSLSYPFIEPFRLQALKDLADRGFFSSHPLRYKEAVEELVRKCRIHAEGCRKRGKLEEAAYWEEQARHYFHSIVPTEPIKDT
ncbi:MAG: glycosyltransferase family 2 protein [Spirochaetes bacterium]|nr:glycosyltransferase family 2 protein [Spirochaetota bacterium]